MSLLRLRWASVVAAGAVALACTGESPTGVTMEGTASLSLASAPGQMALYGLGGLLRETPGNRCDAVAYRHFDFWLGEWNVFGPTGNQAGTNRIVSELGGCLVEENWTGSGGGRGRSMNIYDAATGEWSQYWMDQFRLHLRLFGGLEDGAMVLQGPRIFFTQQGPIDIVDRVTWTPFPNGDVNQFWQVSVDDGSTFPFVFFNGTYVSAPGTVPAPPLATNLCTAPQYAELDFWLGEWDVTAENGLPLGTSSIRSDMEGCMIEEDFTTPGGYASQSFFGWDFRPGEWYRVHADTEGLKLLLSGGVQDGAMVLTGTRPSAGDQELSVTVRIEADGPDRVVQSWETSINGVSQGPDPAVIYTRQ